MVKVNVSRHLPWRSGKEAKLSVYRLSSLKLWNQMNSWDTLTLNLSKSESHQEPFKILCTKWILPSGLHQSTWDGPLNLYISRCHRT